MSSESGETTAPLRSSGRVRKRPETLYDSSPGTSSKRKRGDGDADAPDYHESDDSEIEDQEDGYEEAQPQKRQAKATKPPAQKKPRTNGATTIPIRNAGAGKKKSKGVNGIDTDAADGIFAEIFVENKNVEEVVSQWLQRFTQHESSALSEIINFVLRAAGCTSSVSNHDIEDPDAATDCISDLQDEFQASNPTDYPLMAARGRAANTIKHGVGNFIFSLCEAIAATGVLYEQPVLMENIHLWFSTMSTAANRPFRHTSTVVSLLCATSLGSVAKELESDAAKSQRQAEMERKKKNKARASGIEQKAEEAVERFDFVKALIQEWYDTVFIHRYKDVDAAIRRACAASLGDLIVLLPSVYLDGQYLRYLGWMLSDPQHIVRLEAVKQITRFYKHDLGGGLKAFSERFRPRLVEMATSDAEVLVRTASIELLEILRDNGLLEPNDVDAVGCLIFERDDKVRKTSARFLAAGINELYDAKIDQLGGLEAFEELPIPEDFVSPRIEWIKLKCLAETLQAYQTEELPQDIDRARLGGELNLNVTKVESRFTHAAEDLREKIKEVDDWRVVAGYLLFEFPSKASRKTNDLVGRIKKECVLSDKEELILLHVLLVGARHEITSLAEILATSKNKKQTSDARADLDEAASHLLVTLRELLERYGDSPESSSVLLQLQQSLGLQAIQDLGIDSASWDGLLEQTKRQFLSHTNSTVLDQAVQIILRAKSSGELEDIAKEKLTELWEAVVLDFVQLVDFSTIDQRGKTSAQNLEAFSDNLLRMLRLATISDPTSALNDQAPLAKVGGKGSNKALIDCLLSLTARAQHNTRNASIDKLEDRVAQTAAEIVLFYFRWHFISIGKRVSAPHGEEVPYEELEPLAIQWDSYTTALSATLQQRRAKDEICAAFAGLQIDVHMSAGTLKTIDRDPNVNDYYTVLIMDLDSDKQKSIMKAFAGAEAAYAELTQTALEFSRQDDDLNDFDEDPQSDDEEDEESQSQANREAKMTATLLAERRLCQLTSKIVLAVLGDFLDKKPTRQRVERNKQKLGANFKQVCKYFDLESSGKKLKPKDSRPPVNALSNGVSKSKARGRRNNAIDAESEEEDEIEDDEHEVLKRRELVDIDDEELAD